uniref:polyribonucleotide nucleotidyltransferase n=1 Tax=Entomoneis paludosa TaxID=265537 RepID=A0A6U3D5C1_9STRA|mmetsp:Transcript_38331/g.79705  ORF Transcript_38331/g.79705 Transcript_38331/m.79705 type:complete len:840 (+) Transcript_38331:212-2731(+)
MRSTSRFLVFLLFLKECSVSVAFLPLARVHRTRIHSSIESTADDAEFVLTSSDSGPNGAQVHELRFPSLPGQAADVPEIVMETGRIARQAAGSLTLTRGESVILATAARDDKPKEEIDFLPLSVEHQERFSSAGLTSGSYNKRDGRPAEHEILVCRLIDRPIRPLIAAGWRHETQLLSWVLSYDGVRSCDPLAITASSAALYLSDVPLSKPVAAVQVGLSEDGSTYLLNPSLDEMEKSQVHLTIAGTEDAVLMIEGAADFLPEDKMIQAVKFGHEAIQTLCRGIFALGEAVGVVKNFSTIKAQPEGLQEKVDAAFMDKVDGMYAIGGTKKAQGEIMSTLSKEVVQVFEPEFPEDVVAIKGAFKDLLCRRMFARAQETGLRADGRGVADIRHIDVQAGLLPRVHGSALFTRGETQALATATLGDASMRQKIDTIGGTASKRFYLQYTFPPSSVGETGRVGAPGRREVGHGNLAERALIPIVPSETEFPYTIRVESLITESHGSSSMASVCGGCLALMDAGVPVKRNVAGIAMGMLLGDKEGVSDENAVILSDISGTEDALGTMDFKVAGDREGITTFQLDIKCEGLTLETMERALAQAREGRLAILDEMEKVLETPRDQLPDTVPKIISFEIPADSIGRVIGPGGKQIRALIEDYELVNMDVNEEGVIQMSGYDSTKMEEAKKMAMSLIGSGNKKPQGEKKKYVGPDPVEGENYTGKITGIHPFGVFVEILPGAEDGSTPGLEGLCHVSEMATDRVRNCEGFVRSMNTDELTVKYMGMDRGKIKLSRKAVLEERNGGAPASKGNGRSKERQSPAAEAPAPVMSEEEVDVIAQAIADIKEI